MTALTDGDRQLIARARELAALPDADAIEAYTGKGHPESFAVVLGRAQVTLGCLAGLAERLGGDEGQAPGPGEDSRRLDRIRVVLARFDWEHDDRQLALEAIERIVDGGRA